MLKTSRLITWRSQVLFCPASILKYVSKKKLDSWIISLANNTFKRLSLLEKFLLILKACNWIRLSCTLSGTVFPAPSFHPQRTCHPENRFWLVSHQSQISKRCLESMRALWGSGAWEVCRGWYVQDQRRVVKPFCPSPPHKPCFLFPTCSLLNNFPGY